MEAERLNSPSTSVITFEVLGHQLYFSQLSYCLLQLWQDPNSKHLGTTVWDTSMVFAKFLVLLVLTRKSHGFTPQKEKNCRKGRFCPSKLKGKRVIELGAGMALLGCDVVSTDQINVVPLLRRNVERNTSRILQMNSCSDSFGSIKVAELDWGNEDHIKAVGPPFDYVIGTDVVYAEHLVGPLLQTIIALSGPKTTIMLGHEIRSTSVHEQMLLTWKNFFEVKIVSKAKMDSKYQHPSIQLFIMGLKPPLVTVDSAVSTEKQEKTDWGIDDQVNETESSSSVDDLLKRIKK
ncbi:protein N-lysine methyltransferase METTL21A isoform X1 [Gossypium australe]|uniref:Protein N-lysine methyltransferase METTL21A isoform X1 n=1 Tax=Gossypium australe TaxID=47621 RepID=A0A5B6W5Z6_9ROSI|nr:protein N-lysine methyltransferase METTL21A isoform X1 [Gossypium australe]